MFNDKDFHNSSDTAGSPVHEAAHYKVEPTGKKSSGNGIGAKVVALCLCCALVGGAAGGVGVASVMGSRSSAGVSDSSSDSSALKESDRTATAVPAASVNGKEITASQIYAANVNSTVGITCNVTTTNIFGMTTTGAAAGSGFIVTEDGYIVTNYHVVEGGTSITAEFYDGTSHDAALIGYDEENDLAVLKIDATGLTPVTLGDSSTLAVGETVVAIGNPLGELTFSLTQGVVSALNRSVTLSSDTASGSITMNLIQTDCAINSGNSGGPLFNSYGEVIGITNAKYSSSSSSSNASIDNIGFAIPINQVKTIISDIIEKGYVTKPYLGISVVTVDASAAAAYDMAEGVYVKEVTSGSCAEKAGMKQGDIITAINGTSVASTSELNSVKNQYAPGDTVTVTVDRNGQSVDLSVTLDEQIESADTQQQQQQSQQSQQQGQQQQQQNQNGGYYYYNIPGFGGFGF